MVRSELEMPAAQAAGAGLSGGRRAVWRQAVRALFVSDVHLGSPHACAEEFLALLNSYDPQRLYLVGDIVDGRRLRKRWHWPEIYNQILARMTEILDRGGQVFYTPGNHDEFIREILPHLPPLFRTDRFCIADEFLYESKLGARMLVTHGDQFDRHEQAAGWVSRLVTIAYDWLLHIDNWQTEWRAGRERRRTARRAKRLVPRLAGFLWEFEQIAVSYAQRGGYDGVICGHVHEPKIVSREAISYCNAGDWIEHCSALIEHATGDWELTYFDPDRMTRNLDQNLSQARRLPPTWRTAPAGQNVRATLLKSNRWRQRHSFPEALSEPAAAPPLRADGMNHYAAAPEQTDPRIRGTLDRGSIREFEKTPSEF